MEEISTYVDALPESGSVINGAHLKMYMSPDNTFKAINYYMSNAQERIYTEQMDVGKSFENPDNQSPIRFMLDAAARGVDAKFMISEDSEELLSYLRSHGVKAAKMSQNGYSTMHNKGVIIDDCVWISSVNWTENAFLNNRECGLYIMDERVTEFYLAEYMEDWDYNYVPSDDQPLDVPVETVATVSIGAVIIGFLVYLYNNFLGGGKKKKRR